MLRAILPACYLAASWTWVIGMWLPVYLTRDFGWPGFVVFAVPNVIGATAVGVAFRPRRGLAAAPAQAFFERHRGAIHWFSFATICLQLYFCGVLAREHLTELPGAPMGSVSMSMAGVVVLAIIVACMPIRIALAAAALVIAASIGCAVGAVLTADELPAFALPPLRGEATQASFLPLVLTAPAIWLGFLACPHLDATILRIRRDAPDPTGLYAFIMGFFGFFLLMILMTLGYAGRLLQDGTLSPFIVGHILLQASFTMGVHARAMVTGSAFRKFNKHVERLGPARRRIAFALFALALMPALGTAARDMRLPFTRPGYSSVRMLYDSFMALYAIVFPAYLWICTVPKTPAARSSKRARLTGFGVACMIALPGLALGVIGPFDWAIPVGVGAVLVTPWLLPRGGAHASTERAEAAQIA